MGALTVGATTFLVLLYLLQQVDAIEGRKSVGKILTKENNNNNNSNCNIYQGNWVYDESYDPLYNTSICPFIEKQFTCLQNGRPDSLFLKFRWQPSACNLPRYYVLLTSYLHFTFKLINYNYYTYIIIILHYSN